MIWIMDWIHHFQLFLFDFDGLLVNTEHVHYQAYVNVLAKRGYKLDWSLPEFCAVAHLNASSLRETLCALFLGLEPNWPLVYEEKREMVQDLLGAGKVELMPGVEPLLRRLERAGIQRCVVTNSTFAQVQAIRAQVPVLQSIRHWMTREGYGEPKPSPEGYLKAIQLWGQKGDRMIGFEDSIRGIQALEKTPALPVLICSEHHPLLGMASESVVHFTSLEAIPPDWLR
jgi:HAD superfamily hydrolase (TIGR01509 family)